MADRDSNKPCWSHGLLKCIQRLDVDFFDIIQDNQTSLSNIDWGKHDDSISKITDIEWQSLSTLNPRNPGDNQGIGITLHYITLHYMLKST